MRPMQWMPEGMHMNTSKPKPRGFVITVRAVPESGDDQGPETIEAADVT